MLTLFLKAKTKPARGTKLKVYQSHQNTQGPSPVVIGTPAKNLLPQPEYYRRNDIIVKLKEKCSYKVADLVDATDPNDHGLYCVVHIAKDWNDYKGTEHDEHKVEWPANNNPRIVWARELRTNQMVQATINYFKKHVESK